MTTLNRKMKRGTLGFDKDPVVNEYRKLYPIGKGLIFKAINTFGDSKYTHNFCEYLVNRSKEEPNLYKYTFDDLCSDFENGNHDKIIQDVCEFD